MKKLFIFIILIFLLIVPICTQVSFAQGIAQTLHAGESEASDKDTIHSNQDSTATEEYFDAVWRSELAVGWIRNKGFTVLALFTVIGIARLLRPHKNKKREA